MTKLLTTEKLQVLQFHHVLLKISQIFFSTSGAKWTSVVLVLIVDLQFFSPLITIPSSRGISVVRCRQTPPRRVIFSRHRRRRIFSITLASNGVKLKVWLQKVIKLLVESRTFFLPWCKAPRSNRSLTYFQQRTHSSYMASSSSSSSSSLTPPLSPLILVTVSVAVPIKNRQGRPTGERRGRTTHSRLLPPGTRCN